MVGDLDVSVAGQCNNPKKLQAKAAHTLSITKASTPSGIPTSTNFAVHVGEGSIANVSATSAETSAFATAFTAEKSSPSDDAIPCASEEVVVVDSTSLGMLILLVWSGQFLKR
jgi:hypothetical protein